MNTEKDIEKDVENTHSDFIDETNNLENIFKTPLNSSKVLPKRSLSSSSKSNTIDGPSTEYNTNKNEQKINTKFSEKDKTPLKTKGRKLSTKQQNLQMI